MEEGFKMVAKEDSENTSSHGCKKCIATYEIISSSETEGPEKQRNNASTEKIKEPYQDRWGRWRLSLAWDSTPSMVTYSWEGIPQIWNFASRSERNVLHIRILTLESSP